ncbi:SIMPL domain-containing protein [Ereboglobus luteus]|uniref:SIMPL domain-containing protein n=1 Tax=Ereboglobus luteus TaxID=1796921 RepID=A0A2U8E2M0_9BACT|nr:SIMPL domain-containing protein [Ereboglobus luteus]AWI09026.1 hypothetical protein CKA38_07035 [Ereboglobus luteus]
MKTIPLAFILACLLAITANAADRSITTIGNVRIEIPADKVKVRVSIQAVDPTLDGSNAKLDALVDEFFKKAKSLGIRKNEIVLNSRMAEKEWVRDGRRRIDNGFSSAISLTLTLNDVSKFPELATYAGLREELSLWGTKYTSSKEGEARKKAITGALKAARDKAELLAKAGNATLGQLISAEEMDVEPKSRYGSISSNNFTQMEISEGVQSVEFSVRVTATFELK